ncbi:hypothetical protein GCM10020219_018980 [Nonomuraea dietziae]
MFTPRTFAPVSPRRQAGSSGNLYGMVRCSAAALCSVVGFFALASCPYITASIILQLLVVVIPRLEALKKEGAAGQTKITSTTRYLTIGLAVLSVDRLHRAARARTAVP